MESNSLQRAVRVWALTIAFAGTPAFAQTSPEVLAENTLVRMVEEYRTQKRASPTEAINLMCLGETFDQWFQHYDRVFKANLADASSRVVSYNQAKILSVGHQQDVQNIYPRLRPDIVSATRKHRSQLQSENKLPGIPGQMTLSEYYPAQYMANLKECLSQTYTKELERLAPLASDISDETELTGLVYVLEMRGGGGGSNPGLHPGIEYTGKVVSRQVKQSVYDWLSDVQYR